MIKNTNVNYIEKTIMINDLNDIIKQKNFDVSIYLNKDFEDNELKISEYLLNEYNYHLAEYDYFFNIDEIIDNDNKKNT